jgi:hypothetical protein
MKSIQRMSAVELAAYIQSHLQQEGIEVILSGGTSVSFYSHNRYVSKDLDLINANFVARKRIESAMKKMGFREQGRHFRHPDTAYIVEFPDGPLSVGAEAVKEIREVKLGTGILRVISATDCVKDRLCGYYFWGDQQSLVQAVLVAEGNPVDPREIRRWSKAEGKLQEFNVFRERLGQA